MSGISGFKSNFVWAVMG